MNAMKLIIQINLNKMKKAIIVILLSIQSIYSQNDGFESLKNMVRDNQLSFTLQMFDILKSCQVYSENIKDESKPVLINYRRNSLLQEDYWMALVSFKSAKFIFDNNKSIFKNNISEETYNYLKKMLSEDWDSQINGDNILSLKMNMYLKIIQYHSDKSNVDNEFTLSLDPKELDMKIYKPNNYK